ncbi:hypothetical protein D3C71_1281490 [compost metagenome]
MQHLGNFDVICQFIMYVYITDIHGRKTANQGSGKLHPVREQHQAFIVINFFAQLHALLKPIDGYQTQMGSLLPNGNKVPN